MKTITFRDLRGKNVGTTNKLRENGLEQKLSNLKKDDR